MGKDNCQTCCAKQTKDKDSGYDVYGLLNYVLFPRGDKTPDSWVADSVHRILLGWDRLWADRGDPSAAYEVGRAIYFGLGTAPNETEGLRWLLKAAVQGDPLAQYTVAAIGFCRYSKDPMQAEYSFTKKSYATLPVEIRNHFNEKQCQDWLTDSVDAEYPRALRLRAFVPEKKHENDLQSLKDMLLWLEKAQVAGDPFAEGCRRGLIGLTSIRSLFAFPDFVWTPWGTP